MRRPGTPRKPKPLLLRLRPWILPALAAVLGIQLFLGGFDLADVRSNLQLGELDAALLELADAKPGDLPAELTIHGGFRWYTARERARDLAALRALPPAELFESPSHPTLVSPLRRYREPPTEARLREGLPHASVFELTNQQLGMVAARVELDPEQTRIELGTTLLRGTSFVMQLSDAETGAVLPVIESFEVLSLDAARAVGLAFDTAGEHIAVDEPSRALVQAIVALNHGLTEEALEQLDGLLLRTAYEPVARELMALTLVSQGLDSSALRVLDGAPRP